jgi:hypothetical protein
MSKLTFEVAKCTKNEQGNYVWKLVCNSVEKVFGVEKPVKRTYYIGNMMKEAPVGTKFVEDLDNFNIKQYDYPHPETGEVLNLSWLHVKQGITAKA